MLCNLLITCTSPYNLLRFQPENLRLGRHSHLNITDFGFEIAFPAVTWKLCGTPDHLAPEVFASKGYNTSVDW